MTATTILRSEHNHILAMIACLRAACKAAGQDNRLDADTFRTGLELIRNYADKWHHAKEEDLLFPALELAGMPRQGGPIAVMLHEHGLGRTYVRQIADSLDAAIEGDEAAVSMVLRFTLAYADLLTQHIQKENGILFNMADQVLPPEEHARLEQAYETMIPAHEDQGAGARYERTIAELCQKWGVDPQEAAFAGANSQSICG